MSGYWFRDPAEELRDALFGIAHSHISDEFVRAVQEWDAGEDDKREEEPKPRRISPQTGGEM